ncbi:RNA methyltransferase, RsmD [Corchorus olitorius]|uniref:RNA methyltransferase, RsmD n=1 Tax=Corchorus olitorius TaxID=93759 RepID=A0A1R3G3X5_9ROSI|nr:RNA methyltransferase, RsmD [Corchorus olitorius]
MALSSSPVLSPLHFNFNSNNKNLSFLSPNPLLFSIFTKPANTNRGCSTIIFSYKPTSGLTAEDKKVLLERYGFEPNEYIPEAKTKRRKEVQRKGKGKEVVTEEEVKPPRTTHKLLQVLGGKAKRKKLLSPKGMDVRPMMEVVKGAAFDILQVAGGCPASLRPGRWLDLYSGTGSVGIEAISRGCSEVHFVEMDPWVISNVLRPNLEWTGFLDVSVIHPVRVESFLDQAERFVGSNGPFDYISVTPPYTQVDYGTLMAQISNSAIVGEDTFIVVEYPLRTDMLDSCGCLVKIKDRRFGRTHLAIYGPKWAQKKKKSEKTLQNTA